MFFTAGCPAAAGRKAIASLSHSFCRRRSLESAARQAVHGTRFVNATARELNA